MKQKAYLGDGLYAEFDGYQLVLKANSAEHPSDTVYLDPHVWSELVKFMNRNAHELEEDSEESVWGDGE